MIFGLGMDFCQIDRMEKNIQKEHFCRGVFGTAEWAALEKLPPHRRAESAAACFAAKEAFLKAAGVGLGGFALTELQALRKESGAPYYQLSGRAAEWVTENGLTPWLTLTHEGGMAGAVAILEKNSPAGD